MSADLASRIGALAAGQLAAQKFVHRLRQDKVIAADVLECLHEVQIEHGVDSPATRGFLTELAKRCR